jgi:tetratricopeptide (TPR) repeat protein
MSPKYYIRIVFIIGFLTVGSKKSLQAQDTYLDSLWKVYANPLGEKEERLKAISDFAWEGYLFSEPDSAIYYAQLEYNLAKKLKMPKYIGDALNTIASAHYLKSDLLEALRSYEEALVIYESIKMDKGIANSLNNIANIYAQLGDYASAIKMYTQSLKLDEKNKDSVGIAASLNNIGLIYKYQGNIEQAISYYEQSLQIKLQNNDLQGVAASFNNLGIVYQEAGDLKKALEFQYKSLAIEEQIGNSQGKASSLLNIGSIYVEMNEVEKAFDCYNKSYEFQQKIGDKRGMSNTLLYMAELHFKLGNFGKSILLGRQSLIYSQEVGVISEINSAANFLYSLHKEKKDFQQALEMYELFIMTRDSLQREENYNEITRQEIQYNYDKKAVADSIAYAKEKQIQKAEMDVKNAELQVKKNQQYALFGGLFLVIVFSAFMYNRFKVTQRQKIVIEEQKHIVDEKNQEITDSINYAKRIQEAILPSRQSLIDNLKNGFVLFKPKDVVSGDFYWLETYAKTRLNASVSSDGRVSNLQLVGVETDKHVELNGTVQSVYFAAADCTGHGVPGALVSVVCSNALSKALLEDGFTETGRLLDRTRELVIERFAKSGEEVKDGMDISLVALQLVNKANELKESDENDKPFLNIHTHNLQWSGANNPLWLFNKNRTSWPENVHHFIDKNGQIVGFQIRPNSQPIGLYDIDEPFTTHEVMLEKGDTVYVFTDGYQDQFGGDKGKKFKASQLRELLVEIQDLTMDDQRNVLEDTFEKWRGTIEQIDDVCIIGVRV